MEPFLEMSLVATTFENSVRRLANRVAAMTPVTRDLLTVLTADEIDLDESRRDLGHLDDRGPAVWLYVPAV